MKRKIKLIIIFTGMAIALFGRMFLFQRGLIKEREAESRYPAASLEMKNISLKGEEITVGEDPQLLLFNIDSYVEEIFLEGFSGVDDAEKVQVFYSGAGENFTEENSFYAVPQQEKFALSGEKIQGGIVKLNRDVSALRVDFNGAAGSTYYLSAVVLNPVRQVHLSPGQVVVSLAFGGLIGFAVAVMISERKNLRVYLGALKKYRYLLEDMVARDIKLKYRRSVIGFFWSILNPLLMMCVLTAVFQNLFRMDVDNFAVYYLTGWCVFNFVTEATNGAMTSILNSGALIRKVYIPKYIFPMQKCLFAFVNMLFSLAALLVVMLVLNVGFTFKLFLVPLPLFFALIFSVGLGMLLATAAVFFRDMIHLYTVFTMVWMYLTPIIYPFDILSGAVLQVVKINPMYYYVDSFRKLVLYHTVPDIGEVGIMAAWAFGSLLLGMVVFKKKQDRFILFI